MAEYDDTNLPGEGYAEQPMEEEAPRRAASAQFEVEQPVGSQIALRDAMDPANQSLADALRLSFRVLQLVIVILIVLFIVSGAKTVEQGQSGVATRFGKVIAQDGDAALEPGLVFNWPYPIGDFVLFDAENRSVDITYAFWPDLPAGRKWEDVASGGASNSIDPSREGVLITSDGDLAHMQLGADYVVEDVTQFVSLVRPTGDTDLERPITADDLVRLALQRAAIHVAASTTAAELTRDANDSIAEEQILRRSQSMLDQLESGLRITRVNVREVEPPIKVYQANLRLATTDDFSTAEGEYDSRLTEVAGGAPPGATGEDARPNYDVLLDLIDTYQAQVDRGESEAAEQTLVQINERLESSATSGEAARIIADAESYSARVDSSLGYDAQRFAALYERYKQYPRLVVYEQWHEAIQNVLGYEDVEVFWVATGTDAIKMIIESSEDVAQTRRDADLRRKEQSTDAGISIVERMITPEERRKGKRQLDRSTEAGGSS